MVIDYLPIVTTVVLLFVGFVSFLVRGWVKHVDKNLTQLWEKINQEGQRRENRWEQLRSSCSNHSERLARIEGRMNNR